MANLPSLYEHYTSGGIVNGLCADNSSFTLNNKAITIYSGAMHYFRVPPAYWRDRLRKMRAAGLNAVETYVPWNLHESQQGQFDFGQGNSDYSEFTNITQFLKIAQEEDLLAIVRPGPYICAEWEFGGLPSWLLRYKNMKIRTSDPKFVNFVKSFFKQLLTILAGFQFTTGGPIIAFQIENEYGNVYNGKDPVDIDYMQTLKKILEDNGIVELLFTSDTPSNGFKGTIPGVLATANFQENPVTELNLLKDHQPGKPLMVMEYWTGWFDHWSEKHHKRSVQAFGKVLEDILKFNSSVNMYMFHGGTNWGFLNGANIKDLSTDNGAYQPDTTSYDYDAPLSEAGDYTDKYYKVKDLIKIHNKIKTKIPDLPDLKKRIAYPPITITEKLAIGDLVQQSQYVENSLKTIPMELLDINDENGQSFGYIVYKKGNVNIAANSVLKIEGRVCDSVMVLIDGELKSKILETQNDLNDFGYWRSKDSSLNLGKKAYSNATLELVVENWGRNNFGKLDQFEQHKGLWQGEVFLNNETLEGWSIIPLEFKKAWTGSLKNWNTSHLSGTGPALYKGVVEIDEVADTYIDMRNWSKGVIIVNGFVLARYLRLGPQQCAYLPAPFLRKGTNTILIFEHFVSDKFIQFVSDPIFETL